MKTAKRDSIMNEESTNSNENIFSQMLNSVIDDSLTKKPEVKLILDSCHGIFPNSNRVTIGELLIGKLIHHSLTDQNAADYIKLFFSNADIEIINKFKEKIVERGKLYIDQHD